MFVRHLRTGLLFVVVITVCARNAGAAERFDAATWKKVKTYDMHELQQLDALPPGRIVGVRFNYRHKDVHELHPHWFLGSIWRVVRDEQKAEFMHVNVMVNEQDLAAFKAITTDFHSEQILLVYGQALQYRNTNFPFLRLIGTRLTRGKRGEVTVGW